MSSCSSENESITEFAEDEAFTEGLEDEAFTGSSEDEAFSESSEDETFSGSSEDEASSGSSEVSQTLCANCLVEPWSQSQLRDLLGECEVEFKYQLSPDQLSSEVDSLCWWCRHLRQYMKREGAIDSVLEGWDITLNSRIPNRIEPKRNSSLLVTISHVDLPTSLSLHFSLGVNVRQSPRIESSLLWTSDGKADKDLLGFDLKIVNEWIRTCLDTHQECNQVDIPSTNAAVSKSHTYRPAQLPTRLIDVEPGTEATTSVRLFESDPLQCGDYLALSYRWGGPQHTVLESLTIGNFLEGISLTTLPLGLQHAIQLTRKLGYRFLWVDALCILQDSGDDKFRELSHMQDYYRNAIMVIQPSGMETVSDGFLGMAKRSPGHPRSTIQITVIEAGDVEQMILLTRDPNFYVSSMEPLNFRAWVLQERLLCPRVLIFPSVGGVVFQCEKAEQFHGELYHTPHSDDSRYRLPHHSGAPYHDFDAEEAHSSWLKIAHDYSQRELSMPADKLVALAGLAGLYSSRYSSQLGKYRFGHWQNFLHIDLCWCVDKHRVQPKIKVERAPSWSWASVDQAEYENHMSPSNNTNCVSHIEIQNHILCLEAPGQLVMKAHLLPLFLSRYIRTEFGCYAAPSLKSERVGQAASDCAEQRLTGWAERLTGWAEQRLTDWAEVCVIPLCSFWDDAKVFNRVEGMLVERNDQGTYRRVGHFVRYENTWDAFLASVETQIITLV